MMRNKDALIEYRNECTLNMKRKVEISEWTEIY